MKIFIIDLKNIIWILYNKNYYLIIYLIKSIFITLNLPK